MCCLEMLVNMCGSQELEQCFSLMFLYAEHEVKMCSTVNEDLQQLQFGGCSLWYQDFSLLGAKVPTENFRSRERKFPGTFAPGIVSSHFFSDKYNLLMIITLIPRRRKTIHVCYRRCLRANRVIFRLDALALSVIATATWLARWLAGLVAGCHTPVLYQNR